jgi:hypothetical protein
MYAMSAWLITSIVGAAVFVPLLIIAIVRFESAAIAFAISASFSIGAMVGFFLSLLLANELIPRYYDGDAKLILMFIFASAGAIGGAAIALWLLRKIAGTPGPRR